MLASQCYRQDLKEQREQKVNSEKSLKRKTKCEEFENLKRRKTDLQNTIENLQKWKWNPQSWYRTNRAELYECFLIFEVGHRKRKGIKKYLTNGKSY